jgi:hypothetical protein
MAQIFPKTVSNPGNNSIGCGKGQETEVPPSQRELG